MEDYSALFAFLPSTIILTFCIIVFWRFFSKAGIAGWTCLIPIYNILALADVAQVSRAYAWKAMATYLVGWIAYVYTVYAAIVTSSSPNSSSIIFGMLVYFAAIIIALVFMFPVYKGIAINFGQPPVFAWGLIFLNVIFFAILSFGNSKYIDKTVVLEDDILDAEI